MSSDMHDLLSRMADELDYYRQLLTDDRREVHALATEARAALAAAPESAVKQSLTTAPPAPLEGEVGELVAELEVAAASYHNRGFFHDARRCRRAAILLRQQAAELARLRSAPAVVPVAIPGQQWRELGYPTHFRRIVCPVLPAPQGGEVEG